MTFEIASTFGSSLKSRWEIYTHTFTHTHTHIPSHTHTCIHTHRHTHITVRKCFSASTSYRYTGIRTLHGPVLLDLTTPLLCKLFFTDFLSEWSARKLQHGYANSRFIHSFIGLRSWLCLGKFQKVEICSNSVVKNQKTRVQCDLSAPVGLWNANALHIFREQSLSPNTEQNSPLQKKNPSRFWPLN